MKKLIIFLSIMLAVIKTTAQINESDARLMFKKAQDLYESKDFIESSSISLELKTKMGKWTPKVLFLYLESILKSYTDDNRNSNNEYNIKYPLFKKYNDLCDTFFLQVNKESYPEEKYLEIQNAQLYFTRMLRETEYQSSRTPEMAISFLNECARKFPREKGGYYSSVVLNKESGKNFVLFKIDNSYLKIIDFKESNDNFDFNSRKLEFRRKKTGCKAGIEIELYDLFHRPFIDEYVPNEYDDEITPTSLYNFKNAGEVNYSGTINGQDTIPIFKNIIFEGKEYYCLVIPSTSRSFVNGRRKVINRSQAEYNLMYYFENSEEFKSGNYRKRIIEAFWYLMDYYPKEKSKPKEKKEEKRDTGF